MIFRLLNQTYVPLCACAGLCRRGGACAVSAVGMQIDCCCADCGLLQGRETLDHDVCALDHDRRLLCQPGDVLVCCMCD
jgi:hypothetical protein